MFSEKFKRILFGGTGVSLFMNPAMNYSIQGNPNDNLFRPNHADRVIYTSDMPQTGFPKAVDEEYLFDNIFPQPYQQPLDVNDLGYSSAEEELIKQKIHQLYKRIHESNDEAEIDQLYHQMGKLNEQMINVKRNAFAPPKELQLTPEFLESLSEAEKLALKEYTRLSFEDINLGLRENYSTGKTRLKKEQVDTIFHIDNIMRRAPVVKTPLKVYRGLLDFDHEWDHTSPFISTTTRRSVAEHFGRNYVLEIEIVPGTRVLSLRELSHYKEEEEILLPRNGKVTFVGHSFDPETKKEIIKLRFESHSITYFNPLIAVKEDNRSIIIKSWSQVYKWLPAVIMYYTVRNVSKKTKLI